MTGFLFLVGIIIVVGGTLSFIINKEAKVDLKEEELFDNHQLPTTLIPTISSFEHNYDLKTLLFFNEDILDKELAKLESEISFKNSLSADVSDEIIEKYNSLLKLKEILHS